MIDKSKQASFQTRITGQGSVFALWPLLIVALLAACQASYEEQVEELVLSVTSDYREASNLENQTVSGTVVLSVPTRAWMKQVRFYLDDEFAEAVKSPPFEYAVDTSRLSDGGHTVHIEVVLPSGKVRTSDKVEFVVSNDSPPDDSEDAPEPSAPNEPEEPGPDSPEPGAPDDPVDPEPEPEEPDEPADPVPETPPTEVPAGMVEIKLGNNIQSVLDAHPAGTTFYLRAGVHRNQTFKLSTGDELIGENGAILSGAKPLTEFRRDGELWYAPNQTQYGGPTNRYAAGDICLENHTGVVSPRCNYPEDFFIDDEVLHHVASKADVRPGTWYFDYEADRIYFADDPTGRRIETSVTTSGITANGANNVTIRNIVVERYAIPAQSAALQTGEGWLIEDSVFRYNHGIGLRLGTDSTMRNSRSHHNGQLGVSAIGERIVIEDSQIDHNNTAGYASGWAGGGTKFLRTTDMRVSGTKVHDNNGPGLWFDWDNRGSVSYGNTIENNAGAGFLAEASFDLEVRNNLVVGNGFGRTSWLLGAGILVNTSNGVLITDNVVRDNYHGVTLLQAKNGHEIGNVEVRNNRIDMDRGRTGMAVMGSLPNKSYYYNNNISFIGNDYRFGGQSEPFQWEAGNLTFSEWQNLGMDTGASTNVMAQGN